MSHPQAILLWQDNHPTLALWELIKERYEERQRLDQDAFRSHKEQALIEQLAEQGAPRFADFEQLYDRVANWVQEIMIDAAAEVQHQQPDE